MKETISKKVLKNDAVQKEWDLEKKMKKEINFDGNTSVAEAGFCPVCGARLIDNSYATGESARDDIQCSNPNCDWAQFPHDNKGNVTMTITEVIGQSDDDYIHYKMDKKICDKKNDTTRVWWFRKYAVLVRGD